MVVILQSEDGPLWSQRDGYGKQQYSGRLWRLKAHLLPLIRGRMSHAFMLFTPNSEIRPGNIIPIFHPCVNCSQECSHLLYELVLAWTVSFSVVCNSGPMALVT